MQYHDCDSMFKTGPSCCCNVTIKDLLGDMTIVFFSREGGGAFCAPGKSSRLGHTLPGFPPPILPAMFWRRRYV